MKRWLPFACVLAILLSACNTFSQLQEFKSEAGGFAVTVPVPLEEKTEAVDIPSVGKIDQHTFSGQNGDTYYAIAYNDYPEDLIKQTDPKKLLDGGRNGAVSNVNGKLIMELKISLDGNPGREIVIDAKIGNGQDATIIARLYLVGNRLYQVLIIAPKGEVSREEMKAFLESFKLLNQ